jgi:Lrp/AsnC family transcriptional regulator, leucine-responsive regulatory protein
LQRYQTLFEFMPEVLDVVRVVGDDCFVVRCAFAAPADLERVTDGLAVYSRVTMASVLPHAVTKRPRLA